MSFLENMLVQEYGADEGIDETHKQRSMDCCASSYRFMTSPLPQSAAYGNFSGPKAQELVVSRGKVLELLRPNEMGKLVTVLSTDVFGCIRSIAPFRITGASTDYIIIGSDSGR